MALKNVAGRADVLQYWWWTQSRAQRRQWVPAGILAVCVAAAAILAKMHLDTRASAAAARIQSLQQQIEAVTRHHSAPRPPTLLEQLPESLRTDRVVRDATTWATEFGLSMSSLTVQRPIASAGRLQESTIVVELEGGYPEVKRWLRELLGRYAELGLLSLDMQRRTGPQGETLNSSIQLRLYARPAAALPPRPASS